MVHVPVVRHGRPYRSLDGFELKHVQTGEPVARVSQANRGLIARDLLSADGPRRALAEIPVVDLMKMCREAARLYAEAELPLDEEEGTTQSPADYVEMLSATTGMPHSLCRGNMEKIRFVMAEMETVLNGLTRSLDLSVLDRGWNDVDGTAVSYVSEASTLGVVLPSNSPGVHSLWIPSVVLKVPLVMKPGRQEPWSPLRIAQAMITAGFPREAFSFYPTDYSGAAEILLRTDRSMIFGDESTVRPWKNDDRVQLHGPGWSKVLFGADRSPRWEEHLDLVVHSVADNGGRSCLNASGVWMPSHARELAEALADRLATIEARAMDDPQAALAAFSDPSVAHRISAFLDQQLDGPGAVDLTASRRKGGRVVEVGGCTFLLPTVVWCDERSHPLAATELLFPFVSVVEAPQDEILEGIGSTLVATAVTDDPAFRRRLMAARNIDRLNVGEFPTSRVAWDQPHEGNLFEHLYRRRALQYASV